MRKILAATSAILLLSAGAGFAQGSVDPGTGQFDPADLNDDPRPDFVEPTSEPDTTAGVGILPGMGAESSTMAQTSGCFRIEPGTGEFQPSDENDVPHPDFVIDECAIGQSVARAGAGFDEMDVDRSLTTAAVEVSPDAITYVEQNPMASASFNGDLTVGATVSQDVELAPVPGHSFAYFYADQRPVLVDPDTRTIMWVR